MACVADSARTARTHACGSNAASCTTRRPVYALDSTDDTAAMWYGGTLTSAASSSAAPANSSDSMM